MVIRYEGPRGGPGMREMLTPTGLMKAMGLGDKAGLITDGRFSGATSGLSVGHVSPEAASGGAIALVQDGDVIDFDIPNRRVHLDVTQAELDRRRAEMNARGDKAWRPATRVRSVSTSLRVYGLIAASADKGGARDSERLARLEAFCSAGLNVTFAVRRSNMKITDVKTWAVKNPDFYKGGTYWIFVKLTTDDGISGYGEVYGVPFAPRVVRQMIEDVVARHVVGRSPFDIETIWRILYSSGFSMRPDISMGGVMSGIEIACWDIVGKAVGQPIYNLMGGKVHERLRSYTYLYAAKTKEELDAASIPRRCRCRARPVAALHGHGLHRRRLRPGDAHGVVRPAPALPRRPGRRRAA